MESLVQGLGLRPCGGHFKEVDMLVRASAWRFVLAVGLLGVGFIIAGPVTAGGQAGPNDSGPIAVASYAIVIDNIEVVRFRRLVEMVREVGKPPTVELQGDYTKRMETEAWLQEAKLHPTTGRRDFAMKAYSPEGVLVAQYFFSRGAPSRIRVTGIPSGGSDILRQDVLFTAESVHRAGVSPE